MGISQVTRRQNSKYLVTSNVFNVKQYFLLMADIIEKLPYNNKIRICDIGCASGAFLHYLNERFGERVSLTGIDIDCDLLEKAKEVHQNIKFENADILQMQNQFSGQFDVVTASGLLGFFLENQLEGIFTNFYSMLDTCGTVIIFNSFNKYGVDIHVEHRVNQGKNVVKKDNLSMTIGGGITTGKRDTTAFALKQ